MLRVFAPAVTLLFAACAATPDALVTGTTAGRPAAWAQPVDGKHLENWHRVSTAVYRCAQPNAAGMRELTSAGIQTVINLRRFHSDSDEIEGTDLELVELPINVLAMGYEELVQAVAALVRAEKPVAVHCMRGSDRTGAVVAGWRVAIEGWTPQAAHDEMVDGGYGNSFFFRNIRRLIADLDAEQLRTDVQATVRMAAPVGEPKPQ
ncbi:MAG: tyrosine-protein phosphatase [bacterium]|nr:tyrosine-protein phosphatase [bacterium]